MKTLLIALSALTITAAQAATIEQIDAATNAMDLKQLASYAAEQTADYNNAYANYRLSIMAGITGEKDQAEQALDQAQSTLEQLTAAQPQADHLALLSSVYGMQIGNNPVKGALYGPKSNKAMAQAARIDGSEAAVAAVGGVERIRRQQEEAGRIVGGVLDVVLDDPQAVQLCRKRRSDGRNVRLAAFGHMRRRAGGIGIAQREDTAIAQVAARLAKRLGMAVGRLERAQGPVRAGQCHQRVVDAQEVLGHDVQPRAGQEVVDVGDPAGDGVVDRDHRQVGLALVDCGEDVLEGGAGQGLPVRIDLVAGDLGIRPALALEGNHLRHGSASGLFGLGRVGEHGPRPFKILRGVNPERNRVNGDDVDPHSRLNGAQLLELLALLQR